MCKHIFSLLCLIGSIYCVQAQTINHYEYWLDGDYQSKVTAESSETKINVSLSLDTLSLGLHFFNFRATNSAGETSNVFRTLFYLQEILESGTFAKAECWLDINYKDKMTAEGSDSTISISMPLQGLPLGLHFFNFRATNSVGETSNVFRTLFYLQDTPESGTLVKNEYWMDDDYLHHGEACFENNTISMGIDVSHLSAGLHTFNIRASNSKDEIGTVYRTLFYLPEPDTVIVAGYEYWIDGDSLNLVSADCSQTTLSLEIDVEKLSIGIHTFYFRAKNSFDEWGPIYEEEFEVADATSMNQVFASKRSFSVYNLRGEKVLENAVVDDLRYLPQAIYVIQGRKILIK